MKDEENLCFGQRLELFFDRNETLHFFHARRCKPSYDKCHIGLQHVFLFPNILSILSPHPTLDLKFCICENVVVLVPWLKLFFFREAVANILLY